MVTRYKDKPGVGLVSIDSHHNFNDATDLVGYFDYAALEAELTAARASEREQFEKDGLRVLELTAENERLRVECERLWRYVRAVPLSIRRPTDDDAGEGGLVLGWRPVGQRRPYDRDGWQTVAQTWLATAESQLELENALNECGPGSSGHITHWARLPITETTSLEALLAAREAVKAG